MPHYFFRFHTSLVRSVAALTLCALVLSVSPVRYVEGEEVVPVDDPVITSNEGEVQVPAPDAEQGATSEEIAEEEVPPVTQDEGGTPLDTEAVGGGTTETPDGSGTDGTDGTSTTDGADGSGTDTGSGNDTPATGGEGAPGTEGGGGEPGTDGGTGSQPGSDHPEQDRVDPIPVVTENNIEESDLPEDEVTGGVRKSGRTAKIETGDAHAGGELSTDANSTNVRSEFDPGTVGDLDTYRFTATGTNSAVVTNDAATLSSTGRNEAIANTVSEIRTGDAVSVFNIANVLNSNIVNSDGFIYLHNELIEGPGSLDLGPVFFPDEARTLADAHVCTLLSCAAENVEYTYEQGNDADLKNDLILEAISGENDADGDYALIETGDAYASANVMNVVNTNIVDSNYRLITYNAVGDLDGDLILPTEKLFDAFFSKPNGLNQAESAEDIHITVENENDAKIENNVETYAETGLNNSRTSHPATIRTGVGESESNILNKVNENVYGGDSMYMVIRIHGAWSGDVVGLPDGLTWEWTPQGIVIYNSDAEIAPSVLLGYDTDDYRAYMKNTNTIKLENNLDLFAQTGDNRVDGLVGGIFTGDAFASANVMNIVNTNIIGANWTMAVINILGDFDGNVSFAKTDLAITGTAAAAKTPVAPNDAIDYTYTVRNVSDTTARNVALRQTLVGASHGDAAASRTVPLGTLLPGASREVKLSVRVDPTIPVGTSTVVAIASVESDEADSVSANNSTVLATPAFRAQGTSTTGTGTGTGTTTDPNTPPGGGSTTNGTTTGTTTGTTGTTTTGTTPGGTTGTTTTGQGTATTTPGTEVVTSTPAASSGGGGGGGGGGSAKSVKKGVDRSAREAALAGKPPKLSIVKDAVLKGSSTKVKAGQPVDYIITVVNRGGTAYDAVVYDVLKNPIGSVMNEQSWELGKVLPGEKIQLTYTVEYSTSTPSGVYTNTARVEAYAKAEDKKAGVAPLVVLPAVEEVTVQGVSMAIGNVGVVNFIPAGGGRSAVVLGWESSKPTNGQVFYAPYADPSPYQSDRPNLGYAFSSARFVGMSTNHLVMLPGLEAGKTYSYRIRSTAGTSMLDSREYTFTVPPQGLVAGASTTAGYEELRQTLLLLIDFLRMRIASQKAQGIAQG